MGGSGTGVGMDFQAEVFAYVAVHGLSDHSLDWFDDLPVFPTAIRMESGGPGDDLKVVLQRDGIVEIQVKAGLKKDDKFWKAIEKLFSGLVADKTLRVVLLIDSRASGTIKNDLRVDVLRLGESQSDGLKSITREVIERISKLGVQETSNEIFSRFRIVVLDVDRATGGRSTARALLSTIVEDSSRCDDAWTTIVDQGHDLVSRRGQKTILELATIVGTTVRLKSDSDRLSAIVDQFRKFTQSAHATFVVPGLDVRLSIENDWVDFKLSSLEDRDYSREQTFAEQLEAYIKGKSKSRVDSCSAEWIVEHDRRPVVIVGGPGAGKSTLSKRITHSCSKRGKLCGRVSLANISRAVSHGVSFEEAFSKEMTDGSGISLVKSKAILQRLTILIADGLDECDPNRHTTANAIVKWSNAHPDCAIVVTTRPVGHSRTLLPDFRHYQIPNFDDHEIRSHSETLHRAAVDDPARQEELIARFDETMSWSLWKTKDFQRRSRGARELSARNPLMLGFLVRLNCDDKPLTGHAVKLYQHIIESAETAQVNDRHSPNPISTLIANETLDLVGWTLCQDRNLMVPELVKLVANEISTAQTLPKFEAIKQVEEVIRFWETRRILERLSSGSDSAVVFLHPSIGEFVAARHLHSLPKTDLDAFLEQDARKPALRRVVELASAMEDGAKIVNCLRELDDPSNPCSTEILIAASCLLECEDIDQDVTEAVVDRLIPRLESPIPLIAIEAASALFHLVKNVPLKIKAIALELELHKQVWSELCGLSLITALGDKELSAAAFTKWMKEFSKIDVAFPPSSLSRFRTFFASEIRELQEMTTQAGIRTLVAYSTPVELEEFVEKHDFKGMGLHLISDIRSVLSQSGHEELSKKVYQSEFNFEKLDQLTRGTKRAKQGDKVFFETLERLGNPVVRDDLALPLPALSAVFQALNMWKMNRWPTIDLAEGSDNVVDTILIATTEALGLDLNILATEASHARRLISDDETRIWSIAEVMPVDVDWKRVSPRLVSNEVLLLALVHHWEPARFVAANLLVECTPIETARTIVRHAFQVAHDDCLFVLSQVASFVCGSETVDVFVQRLSGELTPNCSEVFKQLLLETTPEKTPEVIQILFRALWDDSPSVAAEFADLLSTDLSFSKDCTSRLRTVADHWKQRGSWCNKHSRRVTGSVCDECSSTSGSGVVLPNPRPALCRILCNLNAYSQVELFELLEDELSDVRSAAIAALASVTNADQMLFREILDRTLKGSLGTSLIGSCLDSAKPEVLDLAVNELVASENTELRLLVAKSLSKLPVEKAKKIADKLLVDDAPQCRTQAVRWFRDNMRTISDMR